MKCSLAVLCCIAFIGVAFPNKLYCATPSIPAFPFASFDDDPAIYNDCEYCHAHHNADKDVHPLLNEKKERYWRYLDSSVVSEGETLSVFERESSRKCPRSRIKNRR